MKVLKEQMLAYEMEYDEDTKIGKLIVYPLINVKVGKVWSLGYFDWMKLEGRRSSTESEFISFVENNVIPKINMINISDEQIKLHVCDIPVASFTYDYEDNNLHVIFESIDYNEEVKFLIKELVCDINNSVPRKGKIKKCKINIIKSKINIDKDYSGNVYINILP